jgi:hypothetical protein
MLVVFSGDGLLAGHLSMTALCVTAYGKLMPIALIRGGEEYENLEVINCMMFLIYMFGCTFDDLKLNFT